MERITNETIAARRHNVNRRLTLAGVDRNVFTQRRNGAMGLDEMRPSDGAVVRSLAFGTKREIADFLHAMMTGMDMLQP